MSDTTFSAEGGSPRPEIPKIDGYEILAELGRGGMGVVYKARHLGLNRLVAIKMISTDCPASTSLVRFRTEAQLLARLEHPNIVHIYNVGEQQGHPFLALEFVSGGNLKQKLAAGLPSAKHAARFVEILAHAIHAAHLQQILHRDLKPHNILLVGAADAPLHECVPKITDFGLAKSLNEASGPTKTGAILGTPSYMAPEQAEGRTHDIGPRTDVYALGAILYELLTGRPPFLAKTPLDTILQVTTEPPSPPSRFQPDIPHALEAICLKCLHKAPSGRFFDALALAEELRRFRSAKPIDRTAEPVKAPPPVSQGTSMWTSLAAGAAGCSLFACVFLVVAAGAGWLLWRPEKIDRRANDNDKVRPQLEVGLDQPKNDGGKEKEKKPPQPAEPVEPFILPMHGLGGMNLLKPLDPRAAWRKDGVFAVVKGRGSITFPKVPVSWYVLEVELEMHTSDSQVSFRLGSSGVGNAILLTNSLGRKTPELGDDKPLRTIVNSIRNGAQSPWKGESRFKVGERRTLKLVVGDQGGVLFLKDDLMLECDAQPPDLSLAIFSSLDTTSATIYRCSCREVQENDLVKLKNWSLPKR